jgi:CHASE2 domain-containing sensor protein
VHASSSLIAASCFFVCLSTSPPDDMNDLTTGALLWRVASREATMLLWVALLALVGSLITIVAWPLDPLMVEVVAAVMAVAVFAVICAIEARQ